MVQERVPLRGLCLTGPTACGKTELALALAAELPLEIVSMDSAMVYRGMDIGTAKPPPDVLERFPHHLIDIRDPEDAYSAGEFRTDAVAAFAAVQSRGNWPLLVGGTLLYLRALREGLADLPQRDARVREAIDAEARVHGWAAMHDRLRQADPESAARIKPSDRQRIQRALEVHALTGRPLAELTRRRVQSVMPEIEIAAFAVVPADRSQVAARIERRFDGMVERGFVEEVRRLRARPAPDARHAAMRSVGYRQIWGYLANDYDWHEARRRAIVATRQLAKRQMTWLRSDRACESLPAFASDLGRQLSERVVRRLEQWA
ncbi:MAG TPA: tRNA (adenosine(37)-N6)-dimethylallyltransferase MiaA [Gammaproteobacteria bacterium]